MCEESPTPETPKTQPHPIDVPGPTEGDTRAPGGGAELPFTGPGDVLLAVLLAMLAGTGGMLLLLGATSRQEIEGIHAATDSPSGWALAYRDLLKQQVDRG